MISTTPMTYDKGQSRGELGRFVLDLSAYIVA